MSAPQRLTTFNFLASRHLNNLLTQILMSCTSEFKRLLRSSKTPACGMCLLPLFMKHARVRKQNSGIGHQQETSGNRMEPFAHPLLKGNHESFSSHGLQPTDTISLSDLLWSGHSVIGQPYCVHPSYYLHHCSIIF